MNISLVIATESFILEEFWIYSKVTFSCLI